MESEEQYSDIYLLIVKPNTTWEEETENGDFTIIPLSEREATAVIMDLDEEHYVRDLNKFQVFNIPERFESFKIKNASEENKTYLIMKKEISE